MKDHRQLRPLRRDVIGIALSAALFAAAPIALAQSQAPLKIGAVVSLTGPASSFAKDWSAGFEAYVKAWNERGGHNGRKVVLEKLDDESNPTSAVNAFRRLASDPEVTVIWLGLPSQTAVGIKALSSEFKVPTVSGGGLEALGKPVAPYFFKLQGTAVEFAQRVVEYGKRKGFRKFAMLTSSEANGQAEAAGLRVAVAAAGMELVAAEVYSPTDTNFNAQLTKIRNAGPDFFYNGATGNPSSLIYKQAKQLKLDMPMGMAVAGVTGPFFAAIGGPAAAEGLITSLPVGSVAGAASAEGQAELKKLEDALGKPPITFNNFGWEYGIITEWGLKNSDGSREGLRNALDRAKDVPSINGPITFSPESHLGQDIRGVVPAVMKGGRWTKGD